MTIQNKMYNPSDTVRRQWDQVLATIRTVKSAGFSSQPQRGIMPASKWKPTDVVLELTSPKRQRIEKELHAQTALDLAEAKRAAVRDVQAERPGNILGLCDCVNDVTIPWHERFVPRDFRR